MGLLYFIFALLLTGMIGNDEGKWDWQMTKRLELIFPALAPLIYQSPCTNNKVMAST